MDAGPSVWLASVQGEEGIMFVLVRALTFASLFVALVLVLAPARVLEWLGIGAPPALGAAQLDRPRHPGAEAWRPGACWRSPRSAGGRPPRSILRGTWSCAGRTGSSATRCTSAR